MKRSRPMYRPIPADVRQQVYTRAHWRCLMCGGKQWLSLHHCLPKRLYPHLADEPDNLIVLCLNPERSCHANHEMCARRVPWGKLPNYVRRLAEREGDRAMAYLRRNYPGAP